MTQPEPPLEQQYRWSRTLHELLYKRCWHSWPPFICIASIPEFPEGSSRFYCAKCSERVVTMSDSWPPGGPNYCTWGRAMPALQQMLLKDTNVERQDLLLSRIGDFCISNMFFVIVSGERDVPTVRKVQEVYLTIIAKAQPWHIVKAIAETLQAEAADG